jgi:hypothetical protein
LPTEIPVRLAKQQWFATGELTDGCLVEGENCDS